MTLKVPDQFGDFRGGLGIRRLHALQTPPDQLYYFSRDEMVSLKLVTEIMQL